MRIAINCFAFPDFGRPTRRARFNSSPVDSGRSEKSISSVGVSRPLFRACATRGDDAECLFAIFCSPVFINENKHPPPAGNSQSLEPAFLLGVFQILPFERVWIRKNGGRFLESNAVLSQVPGGFSGVPVEHIYVYTLIILAGQYGSITGGRPRRAFFSRKLIAFHSLTSSGAGRIRFSDASNSRGSCD